MASKWQTAGVKGVRFRSHPTRKHKNRSDRYFAIYYQLDGKRVEEGVGWESEGWTLDKTINLRSELRENQRLGKKPQTLKERTELATAERKYEAAEKARREIEDISFDRFWHDHYAPTASTAKKAQSWHNEEGHYRNWIKPVVGDTPIKEVSPFTLERIKKRLIDKGRTPKTQHAVLATCRQVLNLAITIGIIDTNPVRQIKLPKKDNRRQRFLTEAEAYTLLQTTKLRSEQLHDMCCLSLYTGLRAGEIFKLTWDDINFSSLRIFVRDTKSGRDRHAIMTPSVKAVLEKRLQNRTNDLVFHQKDGRPIREVSRTFERIIAELGWNKGQTDTRLKIVFHSLRHTFASWLAQRGTPLYTVAKLMGHSTTTMTERYAHLAPDNLAAAVMLLEPPTNDLKHLRTEKNTSN